MTTHAPLVFGAPLCRTASAARWHHWMSKVPGGNSSNLAAVEAASMSRPVPKVWWKRMRTYDSSDGKTGGLCRNGNNTHSHQRLVGWTLVEIEPGDQDVGEKHVLREVGALRQHRKARTP